MNKWYRLGNVVSSSLKGITPKYVDESDVIVLNQKCIRHNKIDYSFSRCHDPNKKYSPSKVLRVGDLLFNSTGQGTAGRCAFIRELPKGKEVITDSHVLIVRIDDYYLAECFSYLCFLEESLIQTFMDGSTGQGELDKLRLFNVEFRLPGHKARRSICQFFNHLDAKIEINNKINAELEAMAKLIYDYWFVQFDFPISAAYAASIGRPDLAGKPYQSSGGKMVYNERLKREIPEGWEDGNIMTLANLLGGGTPKTKEPSYWEGSIPFFTPSDFEDSIYVINTKQNITEDGLNSCSSKLFSKGTIFLTARGTVGKVNIASREMAMNQSCYAFKSKENVNTYFLFFYTKDLVLYIKAKASGSIFKSIVSNDIKFTSLAVPTLDIIQKYGDMVKPIFDKILSNKNENQELIKMRDWLLPMLMNGQVKVQAKWSVIDQG